MASGSTTAGHCKSRGNSMRSPLSNAINNSPNLARIISSDICPRTLAINFMRAKLKENGEPGGTDIVQ